MRHESDGDELEPTSLSLSTPPVRATMTTCTSSRRTHPAHSQLCSRPIPPSYTHPSCRRQATATPFPSPPPSLYLRLRTFQAIVACTFFLRVLLISCQADYRLSTPVLRHLTFRPRTVCLSFFAVSHLRTFHRAVTVSIIPPVEVRLPTRFPLLELAPSYVLEIRDVTLARHRTCVAWKPNGIP